MGLYCRPADIAGTSQTGQCFALPRMRTLSTSYAEGFLEIAGMSNMTNPASATIDARCGYFVRAIVGFRGVRPDPGGTSDDSKLTGFECFSPSDNVSDWIAGWLADGPTGIGLGERLLRLGVVTALALCNHFLTLINGYVSMRRHPVK
jgi:hypothetical protein